MLPLSSLSAVSSSFIGLRRFYSIGTTSELLKTLQRLVDEVRNTTKVKEKIATVRKYPTVHEFLRFLFDSGPLYITSKSILSHTSVNHQPQTSYESLTKLLEDLNERRITGHRAIEAAQKMINENEDKRELLLQIFDKDLSIGMGTKLIQKALNPTEEEVRIVPSSLHGPSGIHGRHIQVGTTTKGPRKSFPFTSKELPIALGFPMQHPSVKLTIQPGQFWLISRKLDGIRCLAHYKNGEMKLLTRAGKVLGHLPIISQELLQCSESLRRQNPDIPDMNDFYLDGELCVIEGDSENSEVAFEKMPDDFRGALSIVLSRPSESRPQVDQSRLVFFAFDLIDKVHLSTTILSDRINLLQNALKAIAPLQKVYLLEQYRTEDPFELKKFLDDQRTHRWEGLILRKDCAFVPKRTRDIIKVKDFFEAEFNVLDYRLERMQVAMEGKHVMEELLASIKIDFGGVEVWVGSGFSLEERRRFAADPTQLIGSQVTVRYFQESSSKKRDGSKSLRFPTIKAIYSGTRTV